MPRRIRDYGVAALAMAALFAALTSLDRRVPQQLTTAMESVTSGRWTAPGSPLGNVMMEVASNPVMDNYFVLGMLAAGVVLVLLMVRT
jgi:hypothetical protein